MIHPSKPIRDVALDCGFVVEFPAKRVFAGKLGLSVAVFPRQSGFGGFFDYVLN